jgi:hypothetical protein
VWHKDSILHSELNIALRNTGYLPVKLLHGNNILMRMASLLFSRSMALVILLSAPAVHKAFRFSTKDVVSESRKNFAVYADAELDITKNILVAGAVRIEKL